MEGESLSGRALLVVNPLNDFLDNSALERMAELYGVEMI
jgi:hypothetical protein